jgi:hypothetical protein
MIVPTSSTFKHFFSKTGEVVRPPESNISMQGVLSGTLLPIAVRLDIEIFRFIGGN